MDWRLQSAPRRYRHRNSNCPPSPRNCADDDGALGREPINHSVSFRARTSHAPEDCDKLTRRAKFRFSRRPNQVFISSHPVLVRRASAVVTDVGRGAVDAWFTSTMAWI